MILFIASPSIIFLYIFKRHATPRTSSLTILATSSLGWAVGLFFSWLELSNLVSRLMNATIFFYIIFALSFTIHWISKKVSVK